MEFLTRIVQWSLSHRMFVLAGTLFLILFGIFAASRIKVDAIPDITNVQVQIVTSSPSLSSLEIEQYVTFPVERSLAGIPKLKEVRSISRYGFSLVTAIFEDNADLYLARQLVSEKLVEASSEIPPNFGSPKIAPITTGLGEVFQFTLESDHHNQMDLTTYLNWEINPVLKTVPGIVEVNGFGGRQKQYQVIVNPQAMISLGVSLKQIAEAIAQNNSQSGSGYVEKNKEQLILGSDGLLKSVDDFRKIQVGRTPDGFPVYLSSVARIEEGYKLRKGASTANGKGETVGAITLMLLGENSLNATKNVKEKIVQIEKTLPVGMKIVPYYDRSVMVKNTISTVIWNLTEGALLVVVVLFLMMGNLRSGLVIAATIPLAMLFAIGMMYLRDLPANLMSMGAVDFGLIVDGAVILIENSYRRLFEKRNELKRKLTEEEKRETILNATIEVRKATIYGEIIIAIVYLPILTLQGTEGKMFIPMALTVLFALLGAFFLTLTIIPVLASMILDPKETDQEETPLFHKIQTKYNYYFERIFQFPERTIYGTVGAFVCSLVLFMFLGGEFLPKLDEGNLLLEITRLPSSSLTQSNETSDKIEKLLLKEIPEITGVVSRTGSPELSIEPMGLEKTDVYLNLKPKKEWSLSQEDLEEKISELISQHVPEVAVGISQPIEMRNNEIMAGIRADVGIKIYGEDIPTLKRLAEQIAKEIEKEKGVVDLRIEQLSGLQYLRITPNRDKLARYGESVANVGQGVASLSAGHPVGILYEGKKRFDIVIKSDWREDVNSIGQLPVETSQNTFIPLSELTDIQYEDGPVQINHENQNRYALIQFNVRGRDLVSTVEAVDKKIQSGILFPPSYSYVLGGEFQKYKSAANTLMIVVPITLGIILLILYLAFRNWNPVLIIFLNVPFAVTGGIIALFLRQMPFSISAGIGFIALFGVAILNGLVLISFTKEMEEKGESKKNAVIQAAKQRLRPVLTTALLASIGFLPMAISTSPGAEVQRPLATVVIGGIVSASILTLFVLPLVYLKFSAKKAFMLSKEA